jgi:hypothetical protein
MFTRLFRRLRASGRRAGAHLPRLLELCEALLERGHTVVERIDFAEPLRGVVQTVARAV